MRTVLNGCDQSGPATAINYGMEKCCRGHVFQDETNGRLLHYDGDRKMFLPVDGQTYWSASAPRLIVDHFNSPSLHASYSVAKGSDPQAVNFAVVSGIPSAVKGTTGDVGSGVAADAVAIAGPLSFQAGALTRPMRFACRLKLSAITSVMAFVGFTDVLPTTTLELSIELNAGAIVTNATDAVGLVFDTNATLDNIKSVSVANDVDGTTVDSGVAPVADTYFDVLVEVQPDGTARTYLNGTLVASHTIRTAINLCPIVVACTRTTATRDVTIELFGAC